MFSRTCKTSDVYYFVTAKVWRNAAGSVAATRQEKGGQGIYQRQRPVAATGAVARARRLTAALHPETGPHTLLYCTYLDQTRISDAYQIYTALTHANGQYSCVCGYQ